MSSTKANWENVAATKKEQQTALVEGFNWPAPNVGKDVRNVATVSLEGVLSKLDLEITGTDVEVLLAKLASGEWSSVAVTVSSELDLPLLPLTSLRRPPSATGQSLRRSS